MSGTTSTKATKSRCQVKVLEPDQVCDIIKACAEHGVSLIKLGGLEVWFGGPIKPGVIPATPVASASSPPANPTPVAEMTEQQHEHQTKEAIENDELELREQEIAELMVTDPLRAEALIEQGELQDVDDEHGDVE